MDIRERIAYIMKINNLTAAKFADEIGVQRSSVSHILSGRNKPSLDFLLKIINKYPKVDTHWLITGERKAHETPLQSKLLENTDANIQKEFTNVNRVISNDKIEKIIIIYKSGKIKEYNNI